MASALATGAAVWVYSSFLHLPRRQFIPGSLAALWSTLVLWWVAALTVSRIGWVSFVFSLWMDIFTIFTVTLFWSAIDDMFTFEEARRFYGFIAAAGFAGTLPAYAALERWTSRSGASTRKSALSPPGLSDLSGMAGAARMIASSRFLLLLAALVCLERMVPDLLNYFLTIAAQAAYPAREDMAWIFASFGLWQNLISFIVSVALTGWSFRRLGVGGALATAPLANLAGFATFAFMPTLPVAFAYNGLEEMFRYSWFKSAKEAVYTVTTRDVVYRVKAYIEMFLYRFSRGLAGFLLLVLTGEKLLGLGHIAVAAAGFLLALGWTVVALSLGREFRKSRLSR